MRFFDEWKNPTLKCARVGHTPVTQKRRGITRSDSYSCVADKVTQSRSVCSGCREALSGWKDEYRSGINSLSMPSDNMRIFEETGEFWQ